MDLALFGTALHEFLAADITARELRGEAEPAEVRLARAAGLLEARELSGTVEPNELLRASDALREHVAARWPGARWRCEVPVTAMVGGAGGTARRVRGAVDLLLKTEEGLVIVDHKIFVGSETAVWAKAAEYGGQVGAYGEALRLATGRRVVEGWVHFVGEGAVARVEPSRRGEGRAH